MDYQRSLEFRFPAVAKEFHPTKNGELTPDKVYGSSNKKVWWQCPKNKSHIYQAQPNSRTSQKNNTGCPHCNSNKIVSKNNSLAFKYPLIAKEFHPNKNLPLTPESVRYASNKKIWWQCPKQKSHIYEANICDRTLKNSDCPFCSGNKLSYEKSLAFASPKIAQEWHPTKNLPLSPKDVFNNSHKKVWWQCSKIPTHKYQATINHRVSSNSNCPYCSNQSSIPEIRILSELEFIFSEVISRHKLKGKELDVYLPKINVGIEYDGNFYHKKNELRDKEKNIFFTSQGIRLLRIREKPLKAINQDDFLVNNKITKENLNEIILFIKKEFCKKINSKEEKKISLYLKEKEFLNEDKFLEYLNYFPSPLPQHSLAKKFPQICKEWHPTKNKPLTPNNFAPKSNAEVWWQCKKESKHIYKTSIVSRTSSKYGCPYCSSNKLSYEKSLAFISPNIAKEWHSTKNLPLTPEQVFNSSNKKVWWQCPIDKSHIYEASIHSRTRKHGKGCKICKTKNGRKRFLNREGSKAP